MGKGDEGYGGVGKEYGEGVRVRRARVGRWRVGRVRTKRVSLMRIREMRVRMKVMARRVRDEIVVRFASL